MSEEQITGQVARIREMLEAAATQGEALKARLAKVSAERDDERRGRLQAEAARDEAGRRMDAQDGEVAALKAEHEARGATLEQIRAVNAELRANNDKLRAALAEGLADSSLVNSSLEAELAAVKAAAQADRDELEELIGILEQQGDVAHG